MTGRSEWKYVTVHRLTSFIEESVARGTEWAVFEPNDERLWSQMRLRIDELLRSLFTQRALAGETPGDAYSVKCGRETMTQGDVNNGIVNVVVGFAPLKLAEFVMIKVQQSTGVGRAPQSISARGTSCRPSQV